MTAAPPAASTAAIPTDARVLFRDQCAGSVGGAPQVGETGDGGEVVSLSMATTVTAESVRALCGGSVTDVADSSQPAHRIATGSPHRDPNTRSYDVWSCRTSRDAPCRRQPDQRARRRRRIGAGRDGVDGAALRGLEHHHRRRRVVGDRCGAHRPARRRGARRDAARHERPGGAAQAARAEPPAAGAVADRQGRGRGPDRRADRRRRRLRHQAVQHRRGRAAAARRCCAAPA